MRTIVGGRPRGGGGAGEIPRGIDVLILKASVDPAFRELLGRDWRSAAASIGLDLAEAERAVLRSVPGSVLVDMSLRVRVPNDHRPVFLGKVAAAMLALLAGGLVIGCSPTPSPPPSGQTDLNEPPSWHPLVVIVGAKLGPDTDYESEEAVSGTQDLDPRSINEPPAWSPSMPLFGVAPEWYERDLDFEHEDEPDPPRGDPDDGKG
jgi:hypothetical protein